MSLGYLLIFPDGVVCASEIPWTLHPRPAPFLSVTPFSVLTDPAGALQAAFRRYPQSAPAPHCEMSRYVPFPASANWANGLTPEQSCPRALDGTWLMVSMSSPVLSVSSLLRPQSEPQREPAVITTATGRWEGVRDQWVDFKRQDQLATALWN